MICCRSLTALRSTTARFVRNEDGGATIWNLFWLVGFVGMAGLAVDTTNARRHETMLQSTADVASNAAVMSLPPLYLDLPYSEGSYITSEDVALGFSQNNMDRSGEGHGGYILREDVVVGNWDRDERRFRAATEPVNAVQVIVGRNDTRRNSLGTNMLRVLGFGAWGINAASTSMMQISPCLQDGLIAREGVDLASNINIHAGMCIHGQNMVEIQNNVGWHPSTIVTHGEDAYRKIQEGQYHLETQAHVELPVVHNNMEPAMVDMIPTVVWGALSADVDYAHFAYPPLVDPNPTTVVRLRTQDITGSHDAVVDAGDLPGIDVPVRHASAPDPTHPGQWSEVRTASLFGASSLASLTGLANKGGVQGPIEWGDGSNLSNNNDGWVEKPTKGEFDQSYDGTDYTQDWEFDENYEQTSPVLEEGRVYFLAKEDCSGGGNKLTIDGEIKKVTIVAECKIEIAESSVLTDVMLYAIPEEKPGENNFNAISVGEGAQIGADDDCVGGGGVVMMTTKSIHAAASSMWHEAQLVARYDVQFAGQSDAVQGISVHAGRTIQIASNAVIGGLNTPDSSVENPELTSCITDGVSYEWTKYDYSYPIVQ